jgi:DNA-binding transcriptional regulator LsrR (DeoR family)
MEIEQKRKDIVALFKKGSTHEQIAELYGMSRGGVAELLKTCRILGYISEEEYRACARAHQEANLRRKAR